jgi:hypothetical protein
MDEDEITQLAEQSLRIAKVPNPALIYFKLQRST